MTADAVQIRPATANRWDDVADLFERKGPRGGSPPTSWCWCMWWRQRSDDAEKNRASFRRVVADGRVPGLLAYVEDVPVGWIAVAPRTEYGQLLKSPSLKPTDPEEEGVWAIVCFYVHGSAKRRGVARALLPPARELPPVGRDLRPQTAGLPASKA